MKVGTLHCNKANKNAEIFDCTPREQRIPHSDIGKKLVTDNLDFVKNALKFHKKLKNELKLHTGKGKISRNKFLLFQKRDVLPLGPHSRSQNILLL